MRQLPDPIPDDQIVTEADLAQLGFGHRVTWGRRRKAGNSPSYIQLSPHRIAYRWGSIRVWLKERTKDIGN